MTHTNNRQDGYLVALVTRSGARRGPATPRVVWGDHDGAECMHTAGVAAVEGWDDDRHTSPAAMDQAVAGGGQGLRSPG